MGSQHNYSDNLDYTDNWKTLSLLLDSISNRLQLSDNIFF